jgi:hypothetical protein
VKVAAGIRERLWNGDVLRILLAEEVGFDVWVEKYATPPRVYFEGRPRPLSDFDEVVERVHGYLEEEGVRHSWNARIPDIPRPNQG